VEVTRKSFDPEQVDPSTRISPEIESFQSVDVVRHGFSLDEKERSFKRINFWF
jgi:hypothetical protein